jgi:hypothetical protein
MTDLEPQILNQLRGTGWMMPIELALALGAEPWQMRAALQALNRDGVVKRGTGAVSYHWSITERGMQQLAQTTLRLASERATAGYYVTTGPRHRRRDCCGFSLSGRL